MNRRAVLAAVASAGATAGAGCLGILERSDPTGGPVLESDRPAVNETFVAGPTEPYCRGDNYPVMSERTLRVGRLPEERTAAAVERLVARRLNDDTVTLWTERPRRLAWRDDVRDIAEYYRSERYFVGTAGRGDRPLLVVLYEGYTEIRVFETAEGC